MSKETRTKVDDLRDQLKKKGEVSGKQKGHEPSPSPNQHTGQQEGFRPEANGESDTQTRREGPSADELTHEIRSAEEEAKSHYDKLLRVMAEFENFKKRIAREQEEQIKFSNEKLITDLLPSLDDLDRVLDHIPVSPTEEIKAIAEGVEMVRKSLLTTLERFGLKEVASSGEFFDPTRHEAIAAVESAGQNPGKIVSVHRRGYWLSERLLRPALVTVVQEKKLSSENPS